MKNIYVISICAAMLFCGCSANFQKKNYVTPKEINANIEKYDGKEIYIRGYLLLGTNARSLFESKKRYEQYSKAWDQDSSDVKIYEKDCITITHADFFLKNEEKYAHTTVLLKGIIQKNYMDGSVVDLQACSKAAVTLDEEYIKNNFALKKP